MGNAPQTAGSVNEKFHAGVESLMPVPLVDKRKHANVSGASTKERCAIIVNESDDPQDLNEICPQVNGRMYQIQRGKEVSVPPEVVEVLNNAVIDRAIPNPDGHGFTLRPTKRFPYQFVGNSHQVFQAWKQASLDLREAQIEAEQAA